MDNLTKGQKRVAGGFNPSGDAMVSAIKQLAAELIDLIEEIPTGLNVPSDLTTEAGQERARLKALAQTDVEKAAMWAVKAATKR